MMKLLRAAATALVIAASALTPVSSASVRGREALTRTLLQNAIPVDKDGNRILQEEDQFEVTSEYTIQFSSCISLTAGPSDDEHNNNGDGLLFNSDLIAYTQTGKIVNEKSFVLFNVCKTDYCSYYNEDMKSTYMIDINTYMQALAQYYLDEQQKFCAACYYNYNYCEYEKEQIAKYNQYYKTNSKYNQASMAETQYAGTGYSAESGSGYKSYYSSNSGSSSSTNETSSNSTYKQSSQTYQSSQQQSNSNNKYQSSNYNQQNGNRQLSVDMSGFKILNCSKCDEMLCSTNADDAGDNNYQNNANANGYYNGNANADEEAAPQIDMESVAQWIDAMTQCQQSSGLVLNKYPLYSGFMCNEDGTGIEIALFLDDACLTYTSLQSFNKVASEQYDKPYLEYVKNILKFPIENDISCNGNTAYINQEVYNSIKSGSYNGQYNNGEQNQDNQDEPSEFCKTLFEGGENGEAVSIGNCPQEGNNNNKNDNANVVAYDEDGNEQVILYSDYYYSWYQYIVSADNADDARNVCPIVNAMHGEYTYIYQAGSGSLYKLTNSTVTGGSSYSTVSHYAQMASERLTPQIIAIISGVVIAATIALCCILYSCCCKSSVASQYSEATESLGRHRRRRSLSQDDHGRRERLVDATTGKLA